MVFIVRILCTLANGHPNAFELDVGVARFASRALAVAQTRLELG